MERNMEKDKKDLILESISQENSMYKGIKAESIHRLLFNDMKIGQVKDLIFQIKEEQPKVAEVYEKFPVHISSNDLTIPFLEKGGFTEIERVKKENIDKEKNKKSLETKLKTLQIESIEYQKTIRNLEEELKISSLLKNYWGLILSAIGVGIAIGKLLV
ncbi:hypothetical protein KO506_06845 [Polaribacter vadi]|uniref:hypothetical protein n=1 Tax=Polaribacter TaxID=52959 RepID=UPI001C085D61|nr:MULTISPECIES: hypothetical protein [Polaribacter]MBU3011113.1 hypothetical protein [Polaribacter vadi]MDO6740927.1 hypothetical protein [Polaribacter sp. 1_MG-2023]